MHAAAKGAQADVPDRCERRIGGRDRSFDRQRIAGLVIAQGLQFQRLLRRANRHLQETEGTEPERLIDLTVKAGHRIGICVTLQMAVHMVEPIAFSFWHHIALALQQLDHSSLSTAEGEGQERGHLFPGVQNKALFAVRRDRAQRQRETVGLLFHERNGPREQVLAAQDHRNALIGADLRHIPSAVVKARVFPSGRSGVSGRFFMYVQRGEALFFGKKADSIAGMAAPALRLDPFQVQAIQSRGKQAVVAVPGVAPDEQHFHRQNIATCFQKRPQIQLVRIATLVISLAWAETNERPVDIELIPIVRRDANRHFFS